MGVEQNFFCVCISIRGLNREPVRIQETNIFINFNSLKNLAKFNESTNFCSSYDLHNSNLALALLNIR